MQPNEYYLKELFPGKLNGILKTSWKIFYPNFSGFLTISLIVYIPLILISQSVGIRKLIDISNIFRWFLDVFIVFTLPILFKYGRFRVLETLKLFYRKYFVHVFLICTLQMALWLLFAEIMSREIAYFLCFYIAFAGSFLIINPKSTPYVLVEGIVSSIRFVAKNYFVLAFYTVFILFLFHLPFQIFSALLFQNTIGMKFTERLIGADHKTIYELFQSFEIFLTSNDTIIWAYLCQEVLLRPFISIYSACLFFSLLIKYRPQWVKAYLIRDT